MHVRKSGNEGRASESKTRFFTSRWRLQSQQYAQQENRQPPCQRYAVYVSRCSAGTPVTLVWYRHMPLCCSPPPILIARTIFRCRVCTPRDGEGCYICLILLKTYFTQQNSSSFQACVAEYAFDFEANSVGRHPAPFGINIYVHMPVPPADRVWGVDMLRFKAVSASMPGTRECPGLITVQ
jgi:hypothetical protein